MTTRRFIVAAVAGLLLSSTVSAQMSIKFRGCGGWCIGDRYEQMFVNSSQESIVGQVISIDTVSPMRDMVTGIQVKLKTDREDINVHLGPSWFILFQDMSLSVNDKNIEIRGFRTMIEGKQVIMASKLVRRDRVLLLRDDDGIPYWCGWRPKL
jgi:hypothetical protein